MEQLQYLQFTEVLAAWQAAKVDVDNAASQLSAAMLQRSRDDQAIAALADDLRSRKLRAEQLLLALSDCLEEAGTSQYGMLH